VREKCADLAASAVGHPTEVDVAIPPPVAMGSAQVYELSQHQPPPMMPQHAQVQAPPPMAAPMAPAPGAPPAGYAAAVTALETTIARLEESFAFAVECMQTDMAAAKEQLRQLKALAGQ
jgi:hypothetical protein